MAHDHDHGDGEDAAPQNPFEAILGRIFGGGDEPEATRFDRKKEKEFFDKAKLTAIRVAATLIPPKHQSKGLFGSLLREKFFVPLMEHPLILAKDARKLLDALEEKTGGGREGRPGQPARDEVWGDVLHDTWFNHVAEHAAWDLWVRLRATPEEKEAMLEEMLPVLEKFGPAVTGTFQRFDTAADENGNSPLQAATGCAIDSLKEQIVEKARKVGVYPTG